MTALLCLLVVGGLLGLSTSLAKMSAHAGMDPRTLLTWSVTGAAVVLAAVNAAAGRRPRLDRRVAEYLVVSALIGVVAPNLVLYAAVPVVGAGFVALVIASPPLFTYLGALTLRLERFDAVRAAGVALALAGAALIAARKLSAPDASGPWILATVLAPLLLAAGNLYRTVRWPPGSSPRDLAPGVLAAASVFLVLGSATAGYPLRVPADRAAPLVLIGVQTAAFSIQYVLYFVLQKRGGPVALSLLGSVAAVVGIPIAVLALGERPPEGLLSGGTAIAAGILLVVGRGARRRAGAASGGAASAELCVGGVRGRLQGIPSGADSWEDADRVGREPARRSGVSAVVAPGHRGRRPAPVVVPIRGGNRLTPTHSRSVRRALGLFLAVALVAPSVAGALYHCRSAGVVLAGPCAADGRSGARASGCCSSERETPADPPREECCESIGAAPSVLASSPGGLRGAEACAVLPALGPPGAASRLAAAELRAPRPRPPGSGPLFLVQGRLLC